MTRKMLTQGMALVVCAAVGCGESRRTTEDQSDEGFDGCAYYTDCPGGSVCEVEDGFAACRLGTCPPYPG